VAFVASVIAISPNKNCFGLMQNAFSRTSKEAPTGRTFLQEGWFIFFGDMDAPTEHPTKINVALG
jgi:hypothetical protein